uniref:hypothetical protein n=1 Tax=Klebsormidium crenulatum TaxID=424406 RepID=UPI00286C699B|nr:hypothetical protein RMD54_pgp001 [Klebsormidium crenulatum]WKT06386.1 hypothetical protein [Klebsormidium crenulatum]
MMQKMEPSEGVFARKVERSALIEKGKTSQTVKKKLSGRPLRAVPSLSDMQAGLAVCKHINSKDMKLVKDFIKNRNIKDRNLIELVEDTSEKLIDINLPYSEEIHEITSVLEKTLNYNNVTATTIFEKEDVDRFSQKRHVAVFFLKTKFRSRDSLLTRGIQKILTVFDEPMSSESEIWENLKNNITQVIGNNLASELTRLELDLGCKMPFYPLPTNVCSLAADHFSLKVSEANEIVWTGLLEYEEANIKEKPLVYTRACERLEILCSDSLIDGYNKTHEARYQDELLSSTGRITAKKRKKSCITDFAEVNKLNPEVRSRFCSDDSDDYCDSSNWYKRE